jgi:hypothetical protein
MNYIKYLSIPITLILSYLISFNTLWFTTIWFIKLFSFNIFWCLLITELLVICYVNFLIICTTSLGQITLSLFSKTNSKFLIIILFLHSIFWWFGIIDLFLELHQTGLLNHYFGKVSSWWSESIIKTLILVINFLFCMSSISYLGSYYISISLSHYENLNR